MATYKEAWVFPCNIKYFNVIDHFAEHDTVIWRRRGVVHEGDVVYIYIGSPIKEIRYKCYVVNERVDKTVLKDNPYAITASATQSSSYIELKLDKEYDEGSFPYSELKENGLGQVQIPARASRKLRAFLERR